MTTTDQQQPPELDQYLLHAAELYALERLASKIVVGPLRAQLQRVHRAAARLWVATFGSLDAPGDPIRLGSYLAEVKRELAAVDPAVAERLTEYVDRALAMGVKHAADEVGVRVATDRFPVSEPRPTPKRPVRASRQDWPMVDIDPVLDDTTRWILAEIDADARKHLAAAERELSKVEGTCYGEVTEALIPSQRAVTAAEQATTTAVNGASNSGIVSVAASLPEEDVQLLWLAERSACVHCLSYAGEVVHLHSSFPVDLTFGAKPLVPWPEPLWLSGPPLHPNCRCRLTVWLGHVEGAPGPSLPEVLKREARRSILKGWSMESESERVRLQAAARLLKRGVNAPKSVLTYAQRAVRKGAFPSRTVPVERPTVSRK